MSYAKRKRDRLAPPHSIKTTSNWCREGTHTACNWHTIDTMFDCICSCHSAEDPTSEKMSA